MILADARWKGIHGIGRFTQEIFSRLNNIEELNTGPSPLSLSNLFWLPYYLHKKNYKLFFNPGFNPVIASPIPIVFTIHDLIHLAFPGKAAKIKKLYYEFLTKPAAKQAYKIITVSEYSKQTILEWITLPEEKIIVVGNGTSACFTPEGKKHTPSYPYLLHVGNTKTHKNVLRLIEAFAISKINSGLKLVLTGELTRDIKELIIKFKLDQKIIFSGPLSNEQLAEYYRGAHAFLLPSLYEGFGIPLIEAMASGIPTLTSNVTSLPEVAGNASILIDPYSIDSLVDGLEKITLDNDLRKNLIKKGFEQIKKFSWDITAEKVQKVLEI